MADFAKLPELRRLSEGWSSRAARKARRIAANIAKLPKPAEAVLTTHTRIWLDPGAGQKGEKVGPLQPCRARNLRYVKAAVMSP